jgi:hypothetical protein
MFVLADLAEEEKIKTWNTESVQQHFPIACFARED